MGEPGGRSLHQHELDNHLLERLAQAGGIGLGGVQLVVPHRRRPARLGGARASRAPCLATVRMRMMVERSTCHASAASIMVTSWRTSWRKISYFCDGVRNRFERRPARSVPRVGSGTVGCSSGVEETCGCCLISGPRRAAKPGANDCRRRCWLADSGVTARDTR
jgi:hypothetical protein